jgi:hypothetical protein
MRVWRITIRSCGRIAGCEGGVRGGGEGILDAARVGACATNWLYRVTGDDRVSRMQEKARPQCRAGRRNRLPHLPIRALIGNSAEGIVFFGRASDTSI